jgi:hypothetical protein
VSVLDFTGAFLATFFVLVAILYTARMRGWTQRTHAEAQFFGPIGSLQFMARVMFEGFRWLIFWRASGACGFPRLTTGPEVGAGFGAGKSCSRASG